MILPTLYLSSEFCIFNNSNEILLYKKKIFLENDLNPFSKKEQGIS